MRMFFNHGLTPGELYSNTPEKVSTRKWRWLNDTFGWSASREDALAGPFKYCMGLILNKIIDDKVRFLIPGQSESYIDFEIVTGDKFIEHKQNGRFSEIDFIESDFTGYALRYHFKGKAYAKTYSIYIGGDLKKKFLDKINSGEKFYTIKDVTINDFIDDVHKVYSELTKSEVKKLLVHGFRRMHSAIKYGCFISIQTNRNINCTVYLGEIYLDPELQIKMYSLKRDRKLRKIEGWKKTPFDGYYYIGLTPNALDKWVKLNLGSRTITRFEKVLPRKIVEELYYKHKNVHIFRFKRKDFKGWLYWADELKLKNLEYLGEAIDRKFYPSEKSWKELIKDYEKRRSINI